MKEVTDDVSEQVRPFDFIRRANPAHFINFIMQEHPQTIALVLAHLEPGKASAIIEGLPREEQSDVVRRIATMDRISPEILRGVERVLEEKLSTLSGDDFSAAGGIESTVEILNLVDVASGKQIIENLEDEDPELAEEIKKRMLECEDKAANPNICFTFAEMQSEVARRVERALEQHLSTLPSEVDYIATLETEDSELVELAEGIKRRMLECEDRAANSNIRFTFADIVSRMETAILEQIEYPALVTALKLSPLWMFKKLSKSMPFFKRCKFWLDIRLRSALFEDVENAREHIISALSSSPEKSAAGDNDD